VIIKNIKMAWKRVKGKTEWYHSKGEKNIELIKDGKKHRVIFEDFDTEEQEMKYFKTKKQAMIFVRSLKKKYN